MRKLLHALLLTKRHWMNQLPVSEIKLFDFLLKPDSVCIDIGAHGGAWSVPLAKKCSKGKIYAIEALPYYAEVLQLALKFLGLKNIMLFNRAVSNTAGKVSLKYKDGSGHLLTGMTHISPGGHEAGTVDVICITLDQFIMDHNITKVDFIKIDVEGFEWFVLQGAKKCIETYRPAVYCEIFAEWTKRYNYEPAAIFKSFAELNYQSFFVNKQQQLEEYKLQPGQLPSDNFLFIHESFAKKNQ